MCVKYENSYSLTEDLYGTLPKFSFWEKLLESFSSSDAADLIDSFSAKLNSVVVSSRSSFSSYSSSE